MSTPNPPEAPAGAHVFAFSRDWSGGKRLCGECHLTYDDGDHLHVAVLEPFTSYVCPKGRGRGHSSVWSGTQDVPELRSPSDALCSCGATYVKAENPPKFAGSQFRVSWEMPPATVTAFEYEDLHGPGVWLRLSAEQWEALPWRPSENVTDDYEAALDQYRRLASWADSHEQPIRNVKLEHRAPPEWTEVVVAADGPLNPAPHLAADWLGPPQGIYNPSQTGEDPTYRGRYA